MTNGTHKWYPGPYGISTFFETLTIHVDGLTGYPILFGKSRDRFTESEASLDVLYLLRRERGLPTALIVGVPLSRQEDTLFLSLSYHLSLKLCDRSEDIEIQVLCGVGLVAVEVHILFDEADTDLSGEQVLDDIEEVTERPRQSINAMDDQRVAITEVF